jgi:hypothetical protein
MAYDVNRRPGTWVSDQAARKSALVWFLAALLVALAVAAAGVLVSSRATTASSILLIALAFAVRRYGNREVDTAINWLAGAQAEESVDE